MVFGSYSGGRVVTWAPWQLPIVEHPEDPRPNEPLVLIHVEHARGRQSTFSTRRRCDTGVLTASLVGKHVVIELGDGVDRVRLLAVGTGEAPPRVRVLRVATAQGRTFCTGRSHRGRRRRCSRAPPARRAHPGAGGGQLRRAAPRRQAHGRDRVAEQKGDGPRGEGGAAAEREDLGVTVRSRGVE